MGSTNSSAGDNGKGSADSQVHPTAEANAKGFPRENSPIESRENKTKSGEGKEPVQVAGITPNSRIGGPQSKRPILDTPGTPAESSYETSLELYSREKRIEPGITFSTKDTALGEMAQGDLQAVVRGRPAKSKLTIDWYVDNIRMDSKEVAPNEVVAYGNDPTTGSYRVVLRQNSKEISRFTFRIAP